MILVHSLTTTDRINGFDNVIKALDGSKTIHVTYPRVTADKPAGGLVNIHLIQSRNETYAGPDCSIDGQTFVGTGYLSGKSSDVYGSLSFDPNTGKIRVDIGRTLDPLSVQNMFVYPTIGLMDFSFICPLVIDMTIGTPVRYLITTIKFQAGSTPTADLNVYFSFKRNADNTIVFQIETTRITYGETHPFSSYIYLPISDDRTIVTTNIDSTARAAAADAADDVADAKAELEVINRRVVSI